MRSFRNVFLSFCFYMSMYISVLDTVYCFFFRNILKLFFAALCGFLSLNLKSEHKKTTQCNTKFDTLTYHRFFRWIVLLGSPRKKIETDWMWNVFKIYSVLFMVKSYHYEDMIEFSIGLFECLTIIFFSCNMKNWHLTFIGVLNETQELIENANEFYSWNSDVKREKKRIRLIYKLFNFFR